MPPALTPALALDYVRELSADVRAGVVLAADGTALAGPPALVPAARALVAAAGDAAEVEAGSAEGVVCAARSPEHAIVAVCGPFALPGLTRQDLRAALAALSEGTIPGAPPAPTPLPPPRQTALQAAAEGLLHALQGRSRA